MSNRALKSNPDSRWRKDNLREGYTTGACATAAAGAAARALLTSKPVREITIDLPVKKNVTFQMARCEVGKDRVTCGVVKDAGDDPDVTHGAEITAMVEWHDAPGVTLTNGPGVGVVTRPGLAVPVGEPAINPVPRRMITRAVTAEADQADVALNGRGIRVTVSVPGGEGLARETLNPRLGIVGGISILGTTGIVKPFSSSAYRASIYVELKVPAENGVRQAVLTTGSRSEGYARQRYPDWPEMGFVQVGDHMDYALKHARRLKFPHVVIAGMIGKISKLAQGRMQTHVSEGGVDLGFLANVTAEMGASNELVARVRAANTAHHVQVILGKAGLEGLEKRLAQRAAEQASAYVNGAFSVEVLLYDMKGTLLGVGRADRVERGP